MLRAMTQPAVNLAGRTTFGQLGALIAGSDLFVGNDSASAQLALGVGTPGVTIFTATGGKPRGLGGPPPVDMVTSAIRRLLGNRTDATGTSRRSGASKPPSSD